MTEPAKTTAVDDARKPDLAETIVRRIVENTIRVSCTRWSIVEMLDEDADLTEDDLVEDALAIALGEDTGCLGDDEMDAEHIDVLFVRSAISELEAQLRQAKENIIPDLETEVGMLQAQLRQEREAVNKINADHYDALQEIGTLKSERDDYEAEVTHLQATVGQQAKIISKARHALYTAEGLQAMAAYGILCAALATCPAPEEKQ